MARTSSLFPDRKQILLLGLLAALAVGIFVGYSAAQNSAGFPLDDAWIHQTYARNLALHGQWAFNPGETSAGATSPLWVISLAPGYWLGAMPYAWTLLLGWLSLWAIGVLGAAVFSALVPKLAHHAAWAGALLILEYHMVWAAASGMETALFAAMCLGVMLMALRGQLNWQVGLLVGMAVLVRPEGVTLLAPLAIAIWAGKAKQPAKVRTSLEVLGGFLAPFFIYLIFNWAISGSLWPNTFYAKQAEYASLLKQPIWTRALQQFGLPLVGVGLLLLPGFISWLRREFQDRRWAVLAWGAWALGLLLLFAVRLPVTYQHGRYAMPAMPVLFVLGAAGLAYWVYETKKKNVWRRRLSVAWLAATAMLGLAFFALGTQAYSRDVAFINTEMVATANWIAENTPPDALVGAHDIGAIGYFSGRKVVDLAGLVSPEIIPFMRNEPRLADELYAWGADYLATFPGWYPLLSSQAELLYQADGVGPQQGGENMAIYRWYSVSE